MRHTQGPWAQSITLNMGKHIVPADQLERPFGASVDPAQCAIKYQHTIAIVGNHECHFTADEFEANARLIAAAPELLEALNHTIYRNHEFSPDSCSGCAKALEAQKKAEGQ